MTVKLTDESVIPFGKHKGLMLKDVPASYLLWLLDEDWARKNHPALIEYIRENQDCLEMEEGAPDWPDYHEPMWD